MTTAESGFRTTELNDLLQRFRSGDAIAADMLARQVHQRLQQLAGQMLKGFPRLKPHTTPDDLFQGAMVRLLKALREAPIESIRHFHNLAAVQLRRELIDLARRCRLPPAESIETLEHAPAPESLDRWIDLHEALAELGGDDRDLITDLFYLGMSQQEIASALGVSAKTVQRRWQSLCLRLYDRLGGRLPET